MITLNHTRGPSRGVTSEAVPVGLALFVISNGDLERVECDLALRLWRFEARHGRGATPQEVRNLIKSRIPADCADKSAHVGQLIANLRAMRAPLVARTFKRDRGRARTEFSLDWEMES